MNEIVERLAQTFLQCNPDALTEDIADWLWLTAHTQVKVHGGSAIEPISDQPNIEQTSKPTEPEHLPSVPKTADPVLSETITDSSKLEIDLRTSSLDTGFGGNAGLPIRTPSARSLPHSLIISRALRPLLKRVANCNAPPQLDEEASVERLTTDPFWLPVFKPATMPWLDLALVIDDTPSMRLWQATLDELFNLLSRQGAFRDVRLWKMRGNLQELSLHAGNSITPRHFKELISPTSTRIILIVSDCVSPNWTSSILCKWLTTWASKHPTTLLQMLPQRLWSQSNLGRARFDAVRANNAAEPNTQLINLGVVPPWLSTKSHETPHIPLISLEPEGINNWAKFITGNSEIKLPAFRFSPLEKPVIASNVNNEATPDPYECFRNNASATAFKLACFLAAAPLRLPVMRLIQQNLVSESDQTHLAEFFLSGLLKRVPVADNTSDDSDLIEYDFLDDEYRSKLLDAGLITDAIKVQERVSNYIAEYQGGANAFQAIIDNPDSLNELSVPQGMSTFAKVSAEVLSRMGGQYAQIAKRIMSGTIDSKWYENPTKINQPEFSEQANNKGELQETNQANIPDEVVKLGKDAVQNFLDEFSQQDTDALYEANMFIIGDGGVGKTSLLRRLYQADKPLSDKPITKGIEICRHEFKLQNGRNFRINIWDFGGQEIYHATNQLFLTKGSLYVLVDDTRRSDNIAYWLGIADLFGDHSPVLIFQNEKHGRSKHINESDIQAKFSNVKEIFHGNLEQTESVDELRKAIEFYVQQLPHVGDLLPSKWIDIRADLVREAKNHPFISKQKYFDIYGKHLEFDQDKALSLSRYLHDLGVFLHFQDEPLLARFVILQITWATEAVYKILDDRIINAKLGYFNSTDCLRIWRDSMYADMRPELLALMQKFELCFSVPVTHSSWLAPQMLPRLKPSDLFNWSKPSDLILAYHFEILPKGIFPRLMVRKHHLIKRADLSWNSGVLFERDNTEVFVEVFKNGHQIFICSHGQNREELLFEIRIALDSLIEQFHGLKDKVTKYLPCICQLCRRSSEPEMYELKNLLRRKENGKFKIECPASYDVVDVQELLDPYLNPTPTSKKDRKHFKVLLVEEQSSWQKILIKYLESIFKGEDIVVNIQIAETFYKALSFLEGNDCDLLITELNILHDGKLNRNDTLLAAFANSLNVPTVVVSTGDKDIVNLLLKKHRVKYFFDKKNFNENLFSNCITQIIEDRKKSDKTKTDKSEVFICYSRHDKHHLNRLLSHLSTLNNLLTWHDQGIIPGEEWDSTIKRQLYKADIILYLVTADSLTSDYIQKVKLPLIEERCDKGECVLIPIIVNFCHWEHLFFAKYNVLPSKDRVITDKKYWMNEDLAWSEVIVGIKKQIALKHEKRLIKIFLVSSYELKEDLDELHLNFRRLNYQLHKQSIYLEIVRWENFLDTMSETRFQDEYNLAVKDCDIFVSLLSSRIGKHKMEEFDIAHSKFFYTKKPLIYIFFKHNSTSIDIDDEVVSLLNFKKKLSDLEHFYGIYDNTEQLNLKIKDQLEKILECELSNNFTNPNRIPCKIFICYSKHDKRHFEQLLIRLSIFDKHILTLHDNDMLPGENWGAASKMQLHQADIVLYLVTPNSITRDYIQQVELPLVEERCDKRECVLIPIIVNFCHWEHLGFAEKNVLPRKGAPIKNTKVWINEDEAWLDVIKGIERFINNCEPRKT